MQESTEIELGDTELSSDINLLPPEKDFSNKPMQEFTIPKGPGGCSGEQECRGYCFKNELECKNFCSQNPDYIGCQNTNQENREERSLEIFFDPTKDIIPMFVNQNFIELDKISSISRYRSGYGHDFSQGTGENCRSMKHYLLPKGTIPGEYKPQNELIKYFAPVDGTITKMHYTKNQYGTEARFDIDSTEYPAFSFSFFHVKLLEDLKEGTKVSAGQHIGYIAGDAHGEIAVMVKTSRSDVSLVSFFDVITDSLFEEYKRRGVQARENFIIPKDKRDQYSLECDTTWERRFVNQQGDTDTAGLPIWVQLS